MWLRDNCLPITQSCFKNDMMLIMIRIILINIILLWNLTPSVGIAALWASAGDRA